MSVYGVKLPDVGEGVAEAELIEWYVDVGDRVTPDTVLADVMTDKATVEISSPVTGVVTFRVGEPGEVLAVGTEFVGVEIEGSDPAPTEPEAPPVDAADPPAESPPPGTAPVELPQPDTVPVDVAATRRGSTRTVGRRHAAAADGRAATDRRARRPGASGGARDRPVVAHRLGSRRTRRARRPRSPAGRVESLIGCVADRCGERAAGGRTTRP